MLSTLANSLQPQLMQLAVVGASRVLGQPLSRGLTGFDSLFKSGTRKFAALADPLEDEKMFCYQCEQTAKGTGCTSVGVCGKSPELSALQDLLLYDLKGLGAWAKHARTVSGIEFHDMDSFLLGATFATMTNVNFDDNRFKDYLMKSAAHRRALKTVLAEEGFKGPEAPAHVELPWMGTASIPHPIDFDLVSLVGNDPHLSTLVDLGVQVGIAKRRAALGNETVLGLQELLTYGLKGMAAYAHHAEQFRFHDRRVHAFMHDALAFLASKEAGNAGDVLSWCLKVGEVNFDVMQLLDAAHNTTFGAPTPSEVSLTPVPGKCILVSGHDLKDLHMLLKQTEGTGINVYTHGEMLPAHGYPTLKAFKHLAGHYGGAWYKQKKDFDAFPGSILMTTNCVLEPLASYRKNLFTAGEVGVAACDHVSGTEQVSGTEKDFSEVIQRALELPGFTKVPTQKKTVLTGFGHKAVLGVADQVLGAVADKKLSHIFLVGGCDGSEPQRKYYADLARKMPLDTLILTLGCGKFRIFDQDFGTLPGTQLPRLLDMGQCNDAYSALVVAQELAKALNCGVNDLPLSLDLSWFEQKAVAVLLTLLHLGVKNIRVGPRMPAFLTPDAVNLLVENFNLMPANTANPQSDIEKMLLNH